MQKGRTMYCYTVRPHCLYRYVLLVFNDPQPALPTASVPCPPTVQVILELDTIEPSHSQVSHSTATFGRMAGERYHPHFAFLDSLTGEPLRANEAATHAHNKVATLRDGKVLAHVTYR